MKSESILGWIMLLGFLMAVTGIVLILIYNIFYLGFMLGGTGLFLYALWQMEPEGEPIKEYPCGWPGCKKIFKSEDGLYYHGIEHKVKKYIRVLKGDLR